MDFEIAASRLREDQSSALARSRASRSARDASARSRREAERARHDAEMRLRSRREDAEIERRTMDAIRRMMHRVEGEIGAMDVGGGGRRSTAAVVAAPAMMTAAAAGEKKRRPPTSSSSPTMPSPMMASGWTLTASSVHGDGDKITLPPSVIETLMADDGGIGGGGRPVAFRIGIPNPEYAFPASAKMGDLIEDVRGNLKKRGIITAISSSGGDPDKDDDGENATMMANERDDDDGDDDDDDDDERQHARAVEAYTDELSHRYLSYTHGTVVEFTEDEGGVGLPSSVSSALLRPNRHSPSRRSRARGGRRGGGGRGGGGGDGDDDGDGGGDCVSPARRTVDPAAAGGVDDDDDAKIGGNDAGDGGGDGGDVVGEAGGVKTPGHPAYGAFDVPHHPVEIVPIKSLPPGTHCTFSPTSASVRHGFYGIRDVRAVLEQSLTRNRATLSLGDVVRAWRRGTAYDLVVSDVRPGAYGAVCCVNTDLNVDVGPPVEDDDDVDEDEEGGGVGALTTTTTTTTATTTAGGGSTSARSPPTPHRRPAVPDAPGDGETRRAAEPPPPPRPLPPEPPGDAVVGVCVVQVRGRTTSAGAAAASSCRRRFDVSASTVADLFAFASGVCGGADPHTFRLVTRFPRRVFALSSSGGSIGGGGEGGGFDADATLESVGICQGQEMFMVELV